MEELTAGSRTTAFAAATVMTLGIATAVYGVIVGDLARSLGGACLAMPALTLLALIAIRRWITDTTRERVALADSQKAADDERLRHVAAQAAHMVEQQRFQRDVAAERQQIAARLEVERAAMDAKFEMQRSAIMVEALEATALMLRDGKFVREPQVHGKVMQFPKQQEVRARQEEHSQQEERPRQGERGRGVSRP